MKISIINEKTRVEILNDPVYGPDSPFFWPGALWHATEFVSLYILLDCDSTKDFLESFKDHYSGVEGYIENTDDPEEEFLDEMYAHFHKLYHGIESWPYHTFFASAFYRVVFHEIFPYQSKWYELVKSIEFNSLEKFYISKGLYDEAICKMFLQSLEEIQQDKEIDKVGGRISYSTWYDLIRILLDLNSDPLVFQEVIKLVEQYNLRDGYSEEIKEAILFIFELPFSGGWLLEPYDTKAFTDSHLVCLSFLRIPTEKGEQAIKRSLAEKSYAPLIDLL